MRIVVLLLAMMMPASLWAAGMKLDSSASEIHFVSVKKGSVAEVHRFKGLTGSIEGASAYLMIDLASVESGIEIRNERMKSMLFEVVRFSSATIKADVSGIAYGTMRVGDTLDAAMPLTLDLHGVRQKLTTDVRVVKLAENRLLVTSRQPLIVQAADFEMEGGIEALRQVASLSSIATAVPVSFQLTFSK